MVSSAVYPCTATQHRGFYVAQLSFNTCYDEEASRQACAYYIWPFQRDEWKRFGGCQFAFAYSYAEERRVVVLTWGAMSDGEEKFHENEKIFVGEDAASAAMPYSTTRSSGNKTTQLEPPNATAS